MISRTSDQLSEDMERIGALTRLEKLRELETDLKELMSKANSRSYAALCKQYRETIKEIEEIEGADNGEDEIAKIIAGD